MKTVLVVGGSRFIGKHLVDRLSQQGHKLTVLNRGSVPKEEFLPEGAEHLVVDRNNRAEMKSALAERKFDVVYDVCCITREHAEIIVDVLKGNVGRHVHVSTGSVYDQSVIPDEVPITEDFPIGPIKEGEHPYMINKRGAEEVLLTAYQEHGYPVIMVRPTFVYGPDNYVYREAYFFDRISRNRPIFLPENGDGTQDLVYVDDLVDLMIELGEGKAEKVLGEAFNGSRGTLISGNMLVNLISSILEKKADIRYIDMNTLKELEWPQDYMLYPYMPRGVLGFSSEKSAKLLGFSHKHTYRAGLEETYKWYVEQQKPEPDWNVEDILLSYLNDKANGSENLEGTKIKLKEAIERTKENVVAKTKETRDREEKNRKIALESSKLP